MEGPGTAVANIDQISPPNAYIHTYTHRETVTHPCSTPPVVMFDFVFIKMMLRGTACEDYGRHCAEDGEYNSNVFYRPSNTLPVCETDETGDFGTGTLDASSNDSKEDDVEHVVQFVYQIQTTLDMTVARLNKANSPLQSIEKALSDTVLAGLFSGSQCTVPPAIKARDQTRHRRLGQATFQLQHQPQQHHPSRRHLQLYYSDQLSGLRAAPADEVLPGTAGGACVSNVQFRVES